MLKLANQRRKCKTELVREKCDSLKGTFWFHTVLSFIFLVLVIISVHINNTVLTKLLA